MPVWDLCHYSLFPLKQAPKELLFGNLYIIPAWNVLKMHSMLSISLINNYNIPLFFHIVSYEPLRSAFLLLVLTQNSSDWPGNQALLIDDQRNLSTFRWKKMYPPLLQLEESRFYAASLKQPWQMFTLTRVSCKTPDVRDYCHVLGMKPSISKSVNLISLYNLLPW